MPGKKSYNSVKRTRNTDLLNDAFVVGSNESMQKE